MATHCEEFGEIKIVKYAKYVGTILDLRSTVTVAPRVSWKDLCEFKNFTIPVLWFFGSVSRTEQPSRMRPMLYNSPRQARTMPFTPIFLCWLHVRPWTRFAWDPYSQPCTEPPPTRHTRQRPRKQFRQRANVIMLPFLFRMEGEVVGSFQVP